MIYIAHRGLFNGPSIELENSPEQITTAIANGFDCELDLWVVNDTFMLGHDKPQYAVDEYWLRNKHFWIHAKNLEALNWLATDTHWHYNYFWHESDKFTLTSQEYIWTYPGCELTSNSIMVMPETIDNTLSNTRGVMCYAICSDYIKTIRDNNENISVR
jgi:hypothetical protein